MGDDRKLVRIVGSSRAGETLLALDVVRTFELQDPAPMPYPLTFDASRTTSVTKVVFEIHTLRLGDKDLHFGAPAGLGIDYVLEELWSGYQQAVRQEGDRDG